MLRRSGVSKPNPGSNAWSGAGSSSSVPRLHRREQTASPWVSVPETPPRGSPAVSGNDSFLLKMSRTVGFMSLPGDQRPAAHRALLLQEGREKTAWCKGGGGPAMLLMHCSQRAQTQAFRAAPPHEGGCLMPGGKNCK